MNLMLIKVNTKDREDIRNSLISLCDCDSDMNGDNGSEYLWYKAAEEGYESNAEYLADYVMEDETDVEKMFFNFMNKWMIEDSNYYDLGWEYDTTLIGDVLVVAIACGHSE